MSRSQMYRVGTIVVSVLAAASAWGAEPDQEHPLAPILQYASERYEQLSDEIADYRCTLVMRERVGGRLLEHAYLVAKIRHEQVTDRRVVAPLGIYLRFLAPVDVEGREVIYVQGRHEGQIIVRRGGQRFAYFTTAIDPAGDLALLRNRYPITEIGIKNLVQRLIELGKEEMQYDECEVKYFTNVKINDRKCTAIEITHPVQRDHFQYHIARIFVDDELQLPIRYAAYDWPEKEGMQPRLLEEYTYLDLKLNVGLTDWDFDHRNSEYQFRKDFTP